MKTQGNYLLTDPPFITALFSNPKWGWIWIPVRLYLAYVWISAGWAKIGNPAWMESGLAIKGYWTHALENPDPAHPTVAYEWYRAFLQALLDSGSHVWFAKVVVIGELLVGIALLLGLLTGTTALFAGFMNWNYMMAGSAGVNPMLFLLAVLLLLAWKTAGWWGLDRWILPLVGTPWKPGKIFSKRTG